MCCFNDKETQAQRVDVTLITPCAKWQKDQIEEPEIKGEIQEIAEKRIRIWWWIR